MLSMICRLRFMKGRSRGFLGLRTIRSTYWTFLGAAIAMVGLSAIVCSVEVAQFDNLTARNKATFNPVTFSLVSGDWANWELVY